MKIMSNLKTNKLLVPIGLFKFKSFKNQLFKKYDDKDNVLLKHYSPALN